MSQKKQRTILVHSYNPYSTQFPHYKVVTRETLHLIKFLRKRNYRIIIDKEDNRKLNYLAEKGLRDFLADPIVAYLKDVPLSIATNIFSNWLHDEWKRKFGDEKNLGGVDIVLEIEEHGRKVRYSHKGIPLGDEAYIRIIEKLVQRTRAYSQLYQLQPPRAEFRHPITLEHTPMVVGWGAEIIVDSEGLKISGIEITHEETLRRVKSGELRGMSIGGIVTESTCSVCEKDYVECNHISGEEYDNKACFVMINGIRLADFSIVKEPVNPLTTIIIDQSYLK